MNKLIVSSLLAAAAIMPSMAQAQTLPDSRVAVVDLQRVYTECNACKAAATQLQSQAEAIRQREQQLAGPLETEGQSIQAEANALNGAQPSAALQQRAEAFEQRRQAAARELQGREETYNRNAAYVRQQIDTQLKPALDAVLGRRGAAMIVPRAGVLSLNPAYDVTNDVLAELNSKLTTVATVAPAPAQTAEQPAGR